MQLKDRRAPVKQGKSDLNRLQRFDINPEVRTGKMESARERGRGKELIGKGRERETIRKGRERERR